MKLNIVAEEFCTYCDKKINGEIIFFANDQWFLKYMLWEYSVHNCFLYFLIVFLHVSPEIGSSVFWDCWTVTD